MACTSFPMAPAGFGVTQWADGTAKMNEDTSTSDAFGMGQLVACLHRLDVPAVHELPSNVFGRDHWLELARSRPDADWALRITENVDRILVAENLGASFDPPAVTASHRDLNAHNVLFSSVGPVLIDWDGAGTTSAVFERASTPVLWAQRHDGDLDPTIATAFVRGYRDGGGEIDEDDVLSLSMSLSGLSWWTERNVRIAVSQPSAHHDELAGWLVGALIRGPDDVAVRQRFVANIISTV